VLRVIAKRTGYCDGFGNFRVDKVSVTPFAASIDEAGSFKVANKFSYFRRHHATLCDSIGQCLSSATGTELPLPARWNEGFDPILIADRLRRMEKEFNFYGLVWELNVAGLGAV
jgi:hypothetical protein